MSQLQVTKITTVDNTTPLILATGNSGGGQIIIQSANTDVSFSGNINFNGTVTGDGTYLRLPSSNVANAAFDTANAAYASANNVAPQVTPAFNTANSAFNTANAAFASANNVAPQVTPSYNTANAAFNTANAAYNAANNVGPQIAPTFNTANSAFATANLASNTATGAYNTANAAYNNANAAFNAANGKFSSSGGTISGAVEITADLTVHGNTRFIDQQTLSVGDPLIYLAANNYSSDVVDIGFVANYVNATSANVHTGLYRSSGTKEYYLFYGYDKEPYNNYIDPTGNNIQQAVLNSTLRTSNVILGGANTINWITAAFAKANASGANVGQTAPTGVTSGKLWWNSDLGKLFVYYTDPANTSSWIETSPSASAIEGSIITGYINPVFDTVNAAYSSVNSNWTVTNAVYGIANTALANTSGVTFAGALTITGNTGIGTTVQDAKLTLKNPSVTGDQTIFNIHGATNTTQLFKIVANQTSDVVSVGTGYGAPLAFHINSSERMRIDASGRLLIGTQAYTQSSAESLEVYNSGQGFSLFSSNSSSMAPVYINNRYLATTVDVPFVTFNDSLGNRAGIFINSSNSQMVLSGQGGYRFHYGSTSPAPSIAMQIDNNGNMSVGPNYPRAKFHVTKGSGAGAAPSGITVANSYIYIGGAEWGVSNDGKYMVAMGYNGTNAPAYMGYEEVNTGGYTYGDITFYTRNSMSDIAPTQRMKIDNSGRVLMPGQPAFHAYMASTTSLASGTGIRTLDSVDFNIGNCFSTSTGRFTAPVTGTYVFFCNISLDNHSTTQGYISAEIYVNGARYNIGGWNHRYTAVAVYAKVSSSYVVRLVANDYVQFGSELQSTETAIGGRSYTYMAGYLVG